jgi:hypothetical protein
MENTTLSSIPSINDAPYSDYESVVELLKKSDNDNAYQDLMSKEQKTLETINKVSKSYSDKEFAKKQFVNMSYADSILKFADAWGDIIEDFKKLKNITDVTTIFLKDDRLIFIGIFFVIISIFIFFVI